MNVEELEPVNYLGYMNDMRRITHEVEGFEVPPKPSEVSLKDLDKIEEQIRLRKKAMASLDVEIQELKDVKRKVENR